MAGFRLTRAAVRDLLEVGRHTRAQWGDAQCRRYLAALDARFHALAQHPKSGRACEEIRAGYRLFREGKHVVSYRPVGAGVEIVRVLHERMLPENHL